MTEDRAIRNPENLIAINDLDSPIYRIFPLWFFEEALRLRQLVLVAPERWEDPWEILASSIMMVDQRTTPFNQNLFCYQHMRNVGQEPRNQIRCLGPTRV
jgi:hypothetical protein